MITLKEISDVIMFEKESIILACIIALPTGALFQLGSDLYKLFKPYTILLWKRIVSKARSTQE